jgi:pimeloyl-ACP methyl ester carboxylesterase
MTDDLEASDVDSERGRPRPVALPARPQIVPRPIRPIRKDEIVIEERGLYIESWLPERRSRRRPLYLLHGELGGSWVWHRFQQYFAARGWEAHALNLRGHYWSDVNDYSDVHFEDYLDDVLAGLPRLSTPAVVVGHGLGGLLAMKVAESADVAGLVLISPALPRDLREPAKPHELREVPDVFRRDLIGWGVLPEAIRRQNPDLSVPDVLRVQHMMGAEAGAVRRDVIQGVAVDRDRVARAPILVLGGGVDRQYPEDGSERLAEWLGAEYQPFGAHSHYGLVAGDESHEQVAMAVQAFLEAHRL